ncbi:MAG: hypothetical protein QN162_08080, partial [Armatimonadota bacterium]|nr:hypothetical protein [Armatimonadota bacterium]
AAGVQPAGLDAGPPAARRLRDVRVITGLDGDVAIEGYLGSLPGPDGGGDDGDRRPDGEA